ncbi:MAG: hypothetical protein JWQ63_167 [Mucilaginibacter sp.]|jgi:hypothetical protein|nr:hypothetical protein [Mucilaginibacter sp.]
MHFLKSAKIYFCFAVFLLVAKPFLGFAMFSRIHPPAGANIFIKVFNKRKQEYAEDSDNNIIAIQKKLADPVKQVILHFLILLDILFPAAIETVADITTNFLRRIHLSLLPRENTWLLNGKLII